MGEHSLTVRQDDYVEEKNGRLNAIAIGWRDKAAIYRPTAASHWVPGLWMAE